MKNANKIQKPEIVDVFGMELQKYDQQIMKGLYRKTKGKEKPKSGEDHLNKKRKLEDRPPEASHKELLRSLERRMSKSTADELCAVTEIVMKSGCLRHTEKAFEFILDYLNTETITQLQLLLNVNGNATTT